MGRGFTAVASARRQPDLSRAVPRSLAGQPLIAKRVATQIQGHARDENRLFDTDRAPPDVVQRRRTGFARLASVYEQRFERSTAMSAQARASLTASQFSGSFRMPSKYSRYVHEHLPIGSFMASSSGMTLQDIDGNAFYDLTGSCGVNVFGSDFYKHCIDEGIDRVRAGTGRIIFGLNCSDADFDAVQEKFVAAATQMREDGWWWEGPAQSSRAIRCSVLVEMLRRRI